LLRQTAPARDAVLDVSSALRPTVGVGVGIGAFFHGPTLAGDPEWPIH